MVRYRTLFFYVVLPKKKNSFPCLILKHGKLLWRRERDSNPRVLAHKLISSQPRYDHFDISPLYFVVIKITT